MFIYTLKDIIGVVVLALLIGCGFVIAVGALWSIACNRLWRWRRSRPTALIWCGHCHRYELVNDRPATHFAMPYGDEPEFWAERRRLKRHALMELKRK